MEGREGEWEGLGNLKKEKEMRTTSENKNKIASMKKKSIQRLEVAEIYNYKKSTNLQARTKRPEPSKRTITQNNRRKDGG